MTISASRLMTVCSRWLMTNFWTLLDASEQAEPMTAADRHDLEYALKLLDSSKPECRNYLWNHFVIGFDYGEIAEKQNLNYDNVRMKIGRCLDEALKVARCLTMPNQNTRRCQKPLAPQKLGHRVRKGWAKKHPTPDKNLGWRSMKHRERVACGKGADRQPHQEADVKPRKRPGDAGARARQD